MTKYPSCQKVATLLSLPFVLQAAQNGVGLCHTVCRKGLYHQNYGKKKAKPAEILLTLSAQYGEETLSR